MGLARDPLVTTEWLADHANDPGVKILDASFKMPGVLPLPKDDFLQAHIPGAVFFDVDAVADLASALPHMFPSAEQFARDVGGLGVGNGDTVVLYDSGTWVAAPRAWWMFVAFGHKDVRVLDGGLKKWRAEGRAVASGAAKAAPASYIARFDPKRVRNKQQLLDNLKAETEQVIDARTRDRFEGNAKEPWPGRRSGRIPGSYNVPYGELIDASTGAMKPVDELRARFADAGVNLDRPMLTSCGSGVSAAVLTLALYRLGIENPALYDGSWAEWGLPDGPEIATGPARS
jgi:thiosulfate/3-mercaptopyruvate sulfurtransferase